MQQRVVAVPECSKAPGAVGKGLQSVKANEGNIGTAGKN